MKKSLRLLLFAFGFFGHWFLLWDMRLFAFGFCLLLLAFGVESF
jgi:hypothetical protein